MRSTLIDALGVRYHFPRERWRTTVAACGLASILAGLLTGSGALAQSAPCRSTATGDLRLHTLVSTTFGNSRTVRVLLPPGYDAPGNRTRYPVLVLLDGQNLFDACLSDVSKAEWRVDETIADRIASRAIRPLIVVGVDHAGRDRGLEFLPYADQVQAAGSPPPKGQQFPTLLADEVLPLVRGRYRTLPGRENTGIGGSSYGAVAALHAITARPLVFGLALLESGPFWVGNEQLLRDLRTSPLHPLRVWFGVGGRETGDSTMNARLVNVMRRTADTLRALGVTDSRLRFRIDSAATHTESAWAARLLEALTFLFPSARR